MIGLIRLTAPDDTHVYVSPGMISFFVENTNSNGAALGLSADRLTLKGTLLFVGGVSLQVQETPNQVISAITRLRQKAEDNACNLKKRLEKEDWQSDNLTDDDFPD